jgi:hypothetical protein
MATLSEVADERELLSRSGAIQDEMAQLFKDRSEYGNRLLLHGT